MNKIILSFILLTASALSGESSPYQGSDVGFKDYEGDIVLTADGMQLVGKLKSIPKLTFSFGELSFEGDDIYMIINHPKERKMHYITMDGHNYMGSVPIDGLEIEAVTAGHKKIDSNIVTAIMPKQESVPSYDKKQKLFTITLDSGDKLTAIIVDPSVNLSDGYETINVKIEDISKFSKNEGIFISKGKYIVKLFTSFVTDEYLKVVIPKSNNQIKFKWSSIASVQKFNPITDEDTIEAIASALQPFYGDNQAEHICVGAGNNKRYKDKSAVGVSMDRVCSIDQSYIENQNDFVGVVRRKENPVVAKVDTVQSEKKKSAEIIKLEPKQLFAAEQDFNVPAGLLFIDDFENSSKIFASADEMAGIDLAYEELEGIEFDGGESSVDTVEESIESEYTFISKNDEKKDEFQLTSERMEELAVATLKQDINLRPQLKIVDVLDTVEGIVAKWITGEVDDEKIIAFNDTDHVNVRSDKMAVNSKPEEDVVMVLIDNDEFGNPFSIAKKLTTNKEYEEFILATGHPRPKHWIEGSITKDQENQPVINVTLADAQKYAKWKNKRLPTQEELDRAQGLDILNYGDFFQEWVEIDNGDSEIEGQDSKENSFTTKAFRLVSDR